VKIILLHGYSGAPNNFGTLKDDLIKKGFNVLNPILPFHSSAKELSSHSCDEFISWLDEYLNIVGDCIIVGYSFGGQLAMCSSHPSIKKRILISPPFNPRFPYNQQWLGKYFPYILLKKPHIDHMSGLEKVPLRSVHIIYQANKKKKNIVPDCEIHLEGDYITKPSKNAILISSSKTVHDPFKSEFYPVLLNHVINSISGKNIQNK
jgi:hypothetical protein